MKEFCRAARIWLMMESTHAAVLEIPAETCEPVAAQYEQHDKGRASAEWPAYTNRPNLQPFAGRPAGWYLIDFARSRHTNPVRIPVADRGDWYYLRMLDRLDPGCRD